MGIICRNCCCQVLVFLWGGLFGFFAFLLCFINELFVQFITYLFMWRAGVNVM